MATFARPTTLVCLLTALALAALPAFGQAPSEDDLDYESSETPDEIEGELTGAPTLHGQLRLSLGDAIAMGLENNLNVEVARYNPRIAEEEHVSSWGAYDPTFAGDLGYTSDDQPNAFALNTVSAAKTRTTDGNLGIAGLVPWLNASIGLDFAGSRTKTNSTIQAVRPEYNSSVTVSADVPLLKNLIWNPTWTAVKTTGILEDSAREEFRRSVMDEVRDIETAYWDLIAREEELRVAQKSLETATALLDQTNTQYEVGVVSKVEVVEARAGVAEREFNLIRAENLYKRSQDVLIDRVLGENLTAGSRMEIEPTDRPEDYVEYQIDVEEAVRKAFEYRPELASARNEVERQVVQKKFARNQMLPEFNVQSSYTATGKRGKSRVLRDREGNLTTTKAAQPTLIGDFGDSVGDWDDSSGGDVFTVRGVVSIPIGNVSARADARKAQFELRRAKTRLVRARQDIILEVRDTARNLVSAQEGIEAAQRRQEAANEQVRAERIRLEHGESTPFDVLEREEDLVDAESQLINAYQLYRSSVTQLDRAQGTILQTRNVVIDDVAKFR
ncbi:MAG: TolC family protein [Myxococcota bacterium]